MKQLAIILCVGGLLASFSNCQAETWQRAEVYLVNWNTLTRARLTPERVRQVATSKRTFHHDASKIVVLLALNQLQPAADHRPEDARLVVDLFTEAGERVTCYASRFDLCTADSTSKHAIDEQFRQRFEHLL